MRSKDEYKGWAPAAENSVSIFGTADKRFEFAKKNDFGTLKRKSKNIWVTSKLPSHNIQDTISVKIRLYR